MSVARHWHRLPSEVVNAPSLEHSRPGWTGLWATSSRWRRPCSLQRSWAGWPLQVPSNPKHSMILWTKSPSSLDVGNQLEHEILYGMSFYVPAFPLCFVSIFTWSCEAELQLQFVCGYLLFHCRKYSHSHCLGCCFAVNCTADWYFSTKQ